VAKEANAGGIDKVEKLEMPFTSKGIFSIIFNLLYLSRFKKGLFHITGDVHYAILALPKDRTILTIHDLVFLHTYKGLRRSLLKWIFLDLPVRKAKYITTISEKSKQEILDYTNCDPQKILIIPNPVDPIFSTSPPLPSAGKFNPLPSAGRFNPLPSAGKFNQSTPLPSAGKFNPLPSAGRFNPSTILFLGTKPNKNLEISIAALFGLDVHLRIIGELSRKQKEMLEKFNIHYSSDFSISPEQLASEYTNADLILFPSTYEGFGLPVIEGFQAERPVITSNISPMKEVAGAAAVLVDPFSVASIREGVINLLSSHQRQMKLVEAGKEKVANYQPGFIAGLYQELWRKLEKP
jgi:glycosyltransferase involved in cell wall biosynthesis